jgi:copper homeostasis protein
MNNLIKESVVENKQEIDLAIACNTNRLELCGDLSVGGLTPSDELIDYCLSKNIPTLIMIRPIEDQFMPNKQTFKIMKQQIKKYRKLPLIGFVFGILKKDNHIDIKRISKLRRLSKDKQTVFHMGFDKIDNKFEAIDQLAQIGITRILTKGGELPAMNNLETLKKIIDYSQNKIEIVIGGKVTDDNFEQIASMTGATQFHGRQLGIKK